MKKLASSRLNDELKLINNRSIQRGQRSLRSLPLNKSFYEDAQVKGLTAENVFLMESKYKVQGSKWFSTDSSLETSFRWLINIGILRREVDGQGLTSRIRLTPLGREILECHPNLLNQKANVLEKANSWFQRNFFYK